MMFTELIRDPLVLIALAVATLIGVALAYWSERR